MKGNIMSRLRRSAGRPSAWCARRTVSDTQATGRPQAGEPWSGEPWPGERSSKRPHVIVSGKTCPECGEVTYLSRRVCTGCGHAYRTIFQSSLAPPPDTDAVPGPSSPGAGRVFLLACVLLVALAAGLIFYFVNFC